MRSWKYTPVTAIRSIDDAEAFRNSVAAFARDHWSSWRHEMAPRSCPFCGTDDAESAPRFADAFEVSRCRTCNSHYVNPVPTSAQLKHFYREAEPIRILNDIYARRSPGSAGFVNDIRTHKVLSCLRRPASDENGSLSVLEVGCNNGRFLEGLVEAAKSEDLALTSAVGIDVDDGVLPKGSVNGIEYRAMDLREVAGRSENTGRFDLICHFELIEHLIDPEQCMRDAARVLRPGGFMVFTTPNAAGLEMEAAGYNDYRLMSHAIFPPMHLNAFSVHNLTLFAVRSGYRMISMETPGRLDVDCAARYGRRGGPMDDEFKALAELDEQTLAFIQALIARMRASSTLLVVLQKPES